MSTHCLTDILISANVEPMGLLVSGDTVGRCIRQAVNGIEDDDVVILQGHVDVGNESFRDLIPYCYIPSIEYKECSFDVIAQRGDNWEVTRPESNKLGDHSVAYFVCGSHRQEVRTSCVPQETSDIPVWIPHEQPECVETSAEELIM